VVTSLVLLSVRAHIIITSADWGGACVASKLGFYKKILLLSKVFATKKKKTQQGRGKRERMKEREVKRERKRERRGGKGGKRKEEGR